MATAPANEDKWANARATLKGARLSVVLPSYRLAHEVADNLACVEQVLAEGGFDYELVPVDDGSGDGTDRALAAYAAAHPRCRPVILAENGGKGNALKAGFRASTGAYVLLLDGDLDIAPRMLPKFFDSMVRHASDVVIGSKRHPESKVQYPWHRRLASFVYFTLVRLFVGLPITDTQTGMKLFKRRVLGEALERLLVKTYAFDLELLAIAAGRGAKISEAPVEIRFGSKFGALKVRTVRQMSFDSLAVFYRLRLLDYYSKVEVPPPLEKPPFVSVVIACPGDSWMLREGLAALARQTYAHFETIVLPDFGEDRTEALAGAPFASDVRWIATGKTRPAEKRNAGIAAAKGDVVAFLDDDAYPEPTWLENAVKYFSDPAIGAVGGPGVTPPGDGFWAKAGGRVYENVFVSGNYRYRYVGGRCRADVEDYPSCNLLVRTDLLRKVGGYRTDFWPGEDTLLCDAIVNGEKKRIVYDPWAIVNHHRRALFLPHLRQLGRYGYHRGYFVKRFPATSRRFSYFVPSLFVVYCAALAAGAGTLAVLKPPHAALAWTAAAAPLALYAGLTLVSSFAFKPHVWLATWAGVVVSHLWYGVKFVQGLLAARAPCEFIGKDHPQGKTN